MFAMFHCGRLDILPVGDLAVRKGFQALYNLKVSINLLCLALPKTLALVCLADLAAHLWRLCQLVTR